MIRLFGGLVRRGASTAAVSITVAVGLFLVSVTTVAQSTSVQGRVLDAAGAPVADATVWAVASGLAPMKIYEDRTDSTGEFVLELAPGRWRVQARKGTRYGIVHANQGRVTIAAEGQSSRVEISLEPAGTLRGRIYDRATGEGLAGAGIWLDAGVLVKANERGEYVYEGLPRGNHYLYTIHGGYDRKRFLIDTTLRDVARVDFGIETAGKIRGVVVDEHGDPVPLAVVWDAGSGHTTALAARHVRCDEDGRFDKDGAVFDRPYRLVANAPGFEESEISEVAVTWDQPVVETRIVVRSKVRAENTKAAVVETPLKTVRGTVVSLAGTPVAGAQLRWLTNRLDANSIKGVSDEKGGFTLEDVPDTDGVIMASAEGHGATFEPVRTRGDIEAKVVLKPEHTAKGRITDDAGVPVPGATVIPQAMFFIQNMGDTKWFRSLSTQTDINGEFELTGLPDSGFTFDILKPGWSHLRRQTLTLDDELNELTLQAGGAIRGKVVREDGSAVNDIRILVQIPKKYGPEDKVGGMFAGFRGIGINFSNADGVFVVSGLVAGNVHRIVAIADGFQDAVQEPITAHPINRLPNADELLFVVGPAPRLSVSVTDERGDALSNVSVFVVDRDPDQNFRWGFEDRYWSRLERQRTDAEGIAEFGRLGYTKGDILVRAGGYGRQRAAWDGTRESLHVILQPEASVNGHVTDSDGRPLGAGQVYLSTSNESYFVALVPADEGRFDIDELPPGDYTVSINYESETVFNEGFNLQAGERKEIVSRSIEALALRQMPRMTIAAENALAPGDDAPALPFATLMGDENSLGEFRGKFVLLDFWATWCGPCTAETPHLKAVYDAFGDDVDFVMIGLSLDPDPSAPKQYVEEHRLDWVQGFLGDWGQTDVPNAFGVNGIPTIMLIAPDGKVIANHLRGEGILEAVEAALE